MKADLTMNNAGYSRHFEQAAHDGYALGSRALSAIKRIADKLIADLRPTSAEEAYLSKAQNHADLERRILTLQSPNRDQSPW